jgi:hypothetical protein
LAAGGILGLLIALPLVGVGLYVRRSRRAAKGLAGAPVPGRPAGPQAAAPSVGFACPGCGHGLRARAALAGKRVKCPRCGAAVSVPGIQAAGPGPTSTRLP